MAASAAPRSEGVQGGMAARQPFTHLGLHWRGPADVPVEVQTSGDGLAWTPWRPVRVERWPGETPRSEQTFGALIGALRHRLVRYRLRGADRVGDVTATCLNVLDGPPLPSVRGLTDPGGLAFAAARAWADGADFRTGVVTREQWGADESLRFDREGRCVWEEAYVAPRMVVAHHTDTDNDYSDAAAEVRAIYTYHAVTQGFGDIAYNALVDREGRIYEGRRGREIDPFGRLERDVLSFGVVAGHAYDYNYGSVGIAVLGSYRAAEPPHAALARLEDLLVFEHGRHQVDPAARVDFARSSRLWRYELGGLSGHRDCNDTDCPGDALYARLQDLQRRVADRLGGAPTRGAIVDGPVERNVWLGDSARYTWTGTPPFDYAFEAFQRELGQDPVDNFLGYDASAMPMHATTVQRDVLVSLDHPGQYTLHVRPSDAAFADRRTVLVDRHVVRDNADEEGVERVGTWTRSRNVRQFYGRDYEVGQPNTRARFAWTLHAPASGRYTVQACWSEGPDRSRAAPYRFGLSAIVHADQTRNGGVWVDLGAVVLDEGESCRVELSATTDGVVIADAVRLLLAE